MFGTGVLICQQKWQGYVDESTHICLLCLIDEFQVTNMDIERFLVEISGDLENNTEHTLSFRHSPLVLLAFAGNRYARVSSRMFKNKSNFGIMVWRLLVMLARYPGTPVSVASKTTGIDKAAISRTLAHMQKDGLVETSAPPSDPRRKSWNLTSKGYNLHRKMLPTSLDLHRGLLADMSDKEISELQRLLTKLLDNLEKLDAKTGDD
jgi:DNA-binding MarR family transcriptional regulator